MPEKGEHKFLNEALITRFLAWRLEKRPEVNEVEERWKGLRTKTPLVNFPFVCAVFAKHEEDGSVPASEVVAAVEQLRAGGICLMEQRGLAGRGYKLWHHKWSLHVWDVWCGSGGMCPMCRWKGGAPVAVVVGRAWWWWWLWGVWGTGIRAPIDLLVYTFNMAISIGGGGGGLRENMLAWASGGSQCNSVQVFQFQVQVAGACTKSPSRPIDMGRTSWGGSP